MNTEELLISFLRNALWDKELKAEDISQENLLQVFKLAKSHDLIHLVAESILKSNIAISDQQKEYLKKERLIAFYRDTVFDASFSLIKNALSEAQISFIPLKGAIIRKLYKESYLRQSCDIDVLVHEEDIEKAVNVLKAIGFTTDGEKRSHDVSLFYGDSHLELHFCIEEGQNVTDKLLNKVWDYSVKKDGYEYAETPEYLVFHLIAHAARHFVYGGCGIKPFIDLKILRDANFYEEQKLLPLLEECNLAVFYDIACKLSDYWFNEGVAEGLVYDMKNYVIKGGAYGSRNNSTSLDLAMTKSKKRYFFRMLFPRYGVMKEYYPSLQGKAVLLPLYYIYRLVSKLFGKRRKSAVLRIERLKAQDLEEIKSVDRLFEGLKLNREIKTQTV